MSLCITDILKNSPLLFSCISRMEKCTGKHFRACALRVSGRQTIISKGGVQLIGDMAHCISTA